MKTLDRLLLLEILGVFAMAVSVFTAIVWIALGPVGAALRYVGMGIPILVILKIVGLNVFPIFVYAFPISMLLAAIFTFVRLSENSEAVALFASGVPFNRLLVPTAGAALLVSLLGFVINNSLVPFAVKTVTDFKRNISKEIKETSEPFGLPPIRYPEGRLMATVWVEGGFDESSNEMRQVTINQYDPKTGMPIATLWARSAKWEGGYNWSLSGVTMLGIGSRSEAEATAIDELDVTPAELADLSVDPDTLDFAQLARRIVRLQRFHSAQLGADETSLWDKIALPLASLIFALVGAPLGLRLQRGSARTIAFSSGFVVIVAYYVLRQFLQILAADEKADPFMAAFLPDFLGTVVAACLIWRAPS